METIFIFAEQLMTPARGVSEGQYMLNRRYSDIKEQRTRKKPFAKGKLAFGL